MSDTSKEHDFVKILGSTDEQLEELAAMIPTDEEMKFRISRAFLNAEYIDCFLNHETGEMILNEDDLILYCEDISKQIVDVIYLQDNFDHEVGQVGNWIHEAMDIIDALGDIL